MFFPIDTKLIVPSLQENELFSKEDVFSYRFQKGRNENDLWPMKIRKLVDSNRGLERERKGGKKQPPETNEAELGLIPTPKFQNG